MSKVLVGAACTAAVLAVPSTAAAAPAVDYSKTAACSYSPTDPGWAYVGRAPHGTATVVFTMRTGTPGAWNAVSVNSTRKAQRWRVATPAGTSFINWVTFLDASDNVLGAQNVNVRCAGTPAEWPA
jgi:hypothetical protein